MIRLLSARKSAVLLVVSMTLPAVSLAELYISPVVRSTVTYDAATVSPDQAGGSPVVIRGTSSRHGEFELVGMDGGKGKDDEAPAAVRYGHNVPLFVAMEHIVPDQGDWLVRIDPAVNEDMPVSWQGGASWEGVLKQVQDQNRLSIAINHAEQVVGVSTRPEWSAGLAYRQPRVWRTSSDISMEDNLRIWLESIDYKLIWDDAIAEVAYEIVSDGFLSGEMFGQGGVLDRVVNMTSKREYPLAADAYHGDKVVHVRLAGYESGFSER